MSHGSALSLPSTVALPKSPWMASVLPCKDVTGNGQPKSLENRKKKKNKKRKKIKGFSHWTEQGKSTEVPLLGSARGSELQGRKNTMWGGGCPAQRNCWVSWPSQSMSLLCHTLCMAWSKPTSRLGSSALCNIQVIDVLHRSRLDGWSMLGWLWDAQIPKLGLLLWGFVLSSIIKACRLTFLCTTSCQLLGRA